MAALVGGWWWFDWFLFAYTMPICFLTSFSNYGVLYLFHLGIKCMLWLTCLNYWVCLFARSTVWLVLQLLSLEEPWTLIIDDALANSFVAPATDDIQDDHQLTCKYLKWFPGFFKVDKWLDFLTDAIHILVMDKHVDIDCFIEHHGDVELSQRSIWNSL